MEDNRRTRKFNLIRDLITLAAQCVSLVYAVIYTVFVMSNKIDINPLCKIYIGLCIVNTSFILLYIINRKVSIVRVLTTQIIESILIIGVNVLAIYTMVNMCSTYLIPDVVFIILTFTLVLSVLAMLVSLVGSTLFSLFTVVHAN